MRARTPPGGLQTLLGLTALLLPFPFFVVDVGQTLSELLAGWAIAWVIGCVLALGGIARLGSGAREVSPPLGTRPGFLLGTVAILLLVAGLLILAAPLSAIAYCQQACPNSIGGPPDNNSSGSCARDCGVSGPPSGIIAAPLGSLMLDAIGYVLLVVAVRRAWREAGGQSGEKLHRDSPT